MRWTAMVVALLAVGACGDDDDAGAYNPDIDPADFVETIDNPYLPLTPGSRWVYEGTGDDGEAERDEVVVTEERREVMGISAVVVRDTLSVDGEVVEDTFDWFAQDRDGTVWYLGEDSREMEDGEVVSTEGSWEAGVDGALPGIAMPAHPAVGDSYRQEYLEGEAEDMAEIVRIEEDGTLVIREWTPLEPDVEEEKTYEPGTGLVREQTTKGGEEQAELVEHTPGA